MPAPLALARARRAQTARVLIETTDLPITDVAFAAGFASVRQFNETRPRDLRRRRRASCAVAARAGHAPDRTAARSRMRLAVRDALRRPTAPRLPRLPPRAGRRGRRARRGTPAPSTCPHGPGTVRLELADLARGGGTGFVAAEFWLDDLRDTAAASERVRRLLDADCDPGAVDEHLGADPLLARWSGRLPGCGCPGQVDGDETAVRTVIGQQVSVTGARTVGGRSSPSTGDRWSRTCRD